MFHHDTDLCYINLLIFHYTKVKLLNVASCINSCFMLCSIQNQIVLVARVVIFSVSIRKQT